MIPSAHNRVAVLHSVEVQEEAIPGEWVRVTDKSSKPIAELVNDYLQEHKASIVYISSPSIDLVGYSKDKRLRMYRCGVSIIYSPKEIVYDDAHPTPTWTTQDYDDLPEGIKQQIANSKARRAARIVNGTKDSQSASNGTSDEGGNEVLPRGTGPRVGNGDRRRIQHFPRIG